MALVNLHLEDGVPRLDHLQHEAQQPSNEVLDKVQKLLVENAVRT